MATSPGKSIDSIELANGPSKPTRPVPILQRHDMPSLDLPVEAQSDSRFPDAASFMPRRAVPPQSPYQGSLSPYLQNQNGPSPDRLSLPDAANGIAFAPPPMTPSPSKMSPPQQPFNFQSTTLTTSPAKPSQRRGHRYKHSSVSMNFFQEPPVRAPLPIPESLPIPNMKECYQAMSKEQGIQLVWCTCHFFVALLVYNCDTPFAALLALAHLLIYDALCATLYVLVDILGNFDVWKQSSLRHPFGLERVEVLAGFALSVALIFVGGDIMSHTIQDMASVIYASEGEHIHSHGRDIHYHSCDVGAAHGAMHWTSMVFRVLLGLLATLISAISQGNNSRIGRTLRYGGMAISSLPLVFSNPLHLLTALFSCGVLLFPLLGPSGYHVVDSILTPLIAGSMCYVGWMLAKALGGMLVMSYPGADSTDEIERQIEQDPLVLSVTDISLWQVHHDLWLASLRIDIRGSDKDEQEIRERAAKIIKEVMGDDGSVQWETTVDIKRTPR